MNSPTGKAMKTPMTTSMRTKIRAHVWVMLKQTVLDPQGTAIQQALASLGHTAVASVREGKFFVLDLEGLDHGAASAEIERIAREVLTNPVIEEFRFEILDSVAPPE
jgi:phosphoribosylformylglycinamidine synthase PurS subunit